MPRRKKPLRERPVTLKELDVSLASFNPLLEDYNRRLRALDTEEEKSLIAKGRELYGAGVPQRRREYNVSSVPFCPLAPKPGTRVTNFSLVEAVSRIPGLPQGGRAVLTRMARRYNLEKQDVWEGKTAAARGAHCSEKTVSNWWTIFEQANFIKSKPGSDRKGDSRLRPDKPRAGGQKRTNHWWMNVNGIFALAYPKIVQETPGNEEPVSPFESVKEETTTANQETSSHEGGNRFQGTRKPLSAKEVLVSFDSDIYSDSEKNTDERREGGSSNAASPNSSTRLRPFSATSELEARASKPRTWVRKIWKAEHSEITVVVEEKDWRCLNELIAAHTEPVLIVSWHKFVTEVTDAEGEGANYAHYKVRPVTYVREKISKRGNPYFDTEQSTREITQRPFRSFLELAESFVADVTDLGAEQIRKEADAILRLAE